MPETREGYSREDELDMMRSPQKWPSWPFLPVKRYAGNMLITGVLADAAGGLKIIAPANIFMLSDVLSDPSNIRPADPEALYDAGWRVD